MYKCSVREIIEIIIICACVGSLGLCTACLMYLAS